MSKSFTITLCYTIMISYGIAWKEKFTGISAALNYPHSTRMGTQQKKPDFSDIFRNKYTFFSSQTFLL